MSLDMNVGDVFRVLGPDTEAGLVGEVAEIPAKNTDDFMGVITRNESGNPEKDGLIGATLSYTWELVEPYATPTFVGHSDGTVTEA